MRRKQQVPMVALVGALLLGGFCLIAGAWKALVERGQAEYGIGSIPEDKWSYLWVGIAIAIMAAALALTVREFRRRRDRQR